MGRKLKLIFQDKDLRKKLLFVLLIFFIFRLGAAMPIPGVDIARLKAFFSGNQFFGLLNIISGGSFVKSITVDGLLSAKSPASIIKSG